MAVVDFAVVTALTEEFEVLKRFVPDWSEKSENASIWYRARIDAVNGRSYEVVAAFQNQMGPLDAQLLTAQLIDRWDPAYIILVGIAGSFDKGIKLGDVIVSQQVFYYDLAKAVAEGLQYRPQGYPASGTLIRQLEALRLDEPVFTKWRQAAQTSAGEKAKTIRLPAAKLKKSAAPLLAHKPEIHFGTVASGSQVIADKRKRQDLLRLHGKIVGTEMEGAGLMHAAFFHKELTTPAIVIKGISDAADKNKDTLDTFAHWRELAKENPARLAIELIRRGRIRPLRTDRFRLNLTAGAPAEAREVIRRPSAPGVSFISFARVIVPEGPLTELHVKFDARGPAGDLVVIEAVLEYTAVDGQRTRQSTELQNSIHVERTIMPAPIRLYLMLSAVATRVEIAVSTSGAERHALWKSN